MTLGGLFSNRGHNKGRAFAVHRNRERKVKLDAFADLLAAGMEPGPAAVQLGYTAHYGRVLLGKLRKGLGWQAC